MINSILLLFVFPQLAISPTHIIIIFIYIHFITILNCIEILPFNSSHRSQCRFWGGDWYVLPLKERRVEKKNLSHMQALSLKPSFHAASQEQIHSKAASTSELWEEEPVSTSQEMPLWYSMLRCFFLLFLFVSKCLCFYLQTLRKYQSSNM